MEQQDFWDNLTNGHKKSALETRIFLDVRVAYLLIFCQLSFSVIVLLNTNLSGRESFLSGVK